MEDDYGYDPNSGRLASVSSGDCTASYGYAPNSDLLQSTTFANGSSTVLTTTRNWNFGFQLASIANYVNGAAVTSHAYTYDAVNRRTQAKLEDGSAWNYGYNDRNELTGANRSWYDSRPVAGQQFGYNYDNIGNRTWAQFGGDTNGNNLQTIWYQANSLNQYTSIVTPGLKDICGAALATNSVTVNGATADRKGEYFHRQIGVLNTNQPVWQNVTNSSGGCTDKGGLVFPANNQALVYDADGNLTFDGVWNYQWDGENRLMSMNMTNAITGLTTNSPGMVTNRLRLDFAYDYLGRRAQKIVSVWNASGNGFQPSSTNNFVYDGWNLVAILDPQCSVFQSFVWGNDLSGTMTKAVGVGALLMVSISSTNCFVAYDGNGNVTAMINTADKSLAARYEYAPYGVLARATGPLSRQNPFRFCSKFSDEESALIYYGNRYFAPSFGRWLSKDKSLEKGGINLFSFCHNNPILRFDTLGDLDYTGVLNVEQQIKGTLDRVLSVPVVGEPIAFAIMFKWFHQDGDYDYKAKPQSALENFDLGSGTPLRSDQFGNFCAGYAAGIAFAKSGNADFISGVLAGGQYYRVKEATSGYLAPGLIGGIKDFVNREVGQLTMIRNGIIEGVSDEILDEF